MDTDGTARFGVSPAESGAGFATRRASRTGPPIPEERLVYGCVGVDRPEAQPFIDELDGLLVYTCPECRQALEELHPLPRE